MQTLLNEEPYLIHREKINDNFTELDAKKFNKTWWNVTGELVLVKTSHWWVPTRERLVQLLGTWITSKITFWPWNTNTNFSIWNWTWIICDWITWLYREVTWNNYQNITDLYPNSATTYVYLDVNLWVAQQPNDLTSKQRRENIFIWVIWKSNWIISFTRPILSCAYDWFNVIWDIFNIFWPVQDWWIRLAGSWNLGVSISAWKIFSLGWNIQDNDNWPNIASIASSFPKNLRMMYRKTWFLTSNDFVIELDSWVLKPWFYDNWSWTLQAVPVNQFTIQNFWISSTGFVYGQYWQTTYWTLALAKDALDSEIRTNWSYTQKMVPLCQIIIKNNATATNNTADCQFINKGKFWFIPWSIIS